MTATWTIQTPLFQINLMIFLGWRSSLEFVRPVFREEGFRLYLIGQSIPTSLQARTRASNAIPAIPFQPSPTPDLLYRNNQARQLLPVECKVSSFGPDREQAKQAAALLTCTGPHVAETLGLTVSKSWSSTLIYSVTWAGLSNARNSQDDSW